jgi:PAS domain S-box-containing protein
MTEPTSPLRPRARARLESEAEPETEGKRTASALRRMVQELRVYQIELDLQKEALHDAQRGLEESRAALKASEQRYHELFDQGPIGHLRLDGDGAIVEANQTVVELLAAPAEALTGRKLSDFITPESQDAYYLRRRAALRDGRSIPVQVVLRASDGRSRDVEIGMRSSEGGPSEIRVAILDVTDREQAATARYESARQRRILADALPLSVSYVGVDGRYGFYNRAFESLCGWSAAPLEGRTLSEVLEPDAYAALRDHVRAALSGEDVRFEGELSFPGTGPRFVSVLFAPDRASDAQVRGFYMLVDDRTELEEARAGLRVAAAQAALAEERERRVLASDLHDSAAQLLSLASIKVRSLQGEVGGASEVALLAEVTDLIRDARQSMTSMSFELSPPMLYDVGFVAASEWLGESLQQRYGLETELATTGGEPEIDEATRVTLFRALRELLINVAKHAGTRRAKVTVQAEEERVLVTVEDGGVGFDPAGRLGGFGIRSLCERIQSLGGSVLFESAPGQGTRVSITVRTGREFSL